MFTESHRTMIEPGTFLIEAECLSSDTKPTTGIYNGSLAKELDTAKLFFFDGENSVWREWT